MIIAIAIAIAIIIAIVIAISVIYAGKQNFQNDNRKAQLRKRLAQEKIINRRRIMKGLEEVDHEAKCLFDPRMVQGGFYSELACKDHCRSVDYREKWGGEYCNASACEDICSRCDDSSFCRWNKAVYKTPDENLPEPIILEYKIEKNDLKLIWEKPASKHNITAYSCIISDPDMDDEFEVDLPTDLECNFCDHLIRNLENGKVYNITIFSRNKYGYSRASNTLRVNMEYEEEVINDGSPSSTSIVTAMNTITSIFRDQLRHDIITKTPDDVITPLDILTEDKKRDSKWLSKYSADVKFQSFI